MKILIDSARIPVIESLMKTCLFHGVTTNPLILKDAGVNLSQLPRLAESVFALGAKELYFQSWGNDAAELYRHGRELAGIGETVVVKLPVTMEGLEAAVRLGKEGITTCITAVYSPYQAILAASAGAAYVAPYLGRMNDAGRDGHEMIALMARALRGAESRTEILAASIRKPEDIAILAANGVRYVTLSQAVAEKLFHEPLSLEATNALEAAARELADQ